jgi:thiamine biosynthesis lipoprotein
MVTTQPTVSRHVIEVMGTVFTLDLRDDATDPSSVDRITADLRWVDATFSTYQPDSEIARLAAGKMKLTECAPEVAEILELCAWASRATGGYFSATADGRLDPSGVVKGWAVARASALLVASGSACHAVNGGGDIQTVGEPEPGRCWRTGIADPLLPDRVLAVVTGAGLAIATSGSAERGHHILDPFSGRPATALLSVSVVGPDIVAADVYATAAVAMGELAPGWLASLPDYEALVVYATGDRWHTPGLGAHLDESWRGRIATEGDAPPDGDPSSGTRSP